MIYAMEKQLKIAQPRHGYPWKWRVQGRKFA
jgi:hypothetical protein